MHILEPWFMRDCFFIALTFGLVFTCLSNTKRAIEEPVTYFVAITPVYFFTFWIGACILLTYATVTRAQVKGWGFFFFILCIISGSLVVDPKDPDGACIWEREYEHVSNQSGSTKFATEGFFAKPNAWVREHRPLMFRPSLASQCPNPDFPRTKNPLAWGYTKQEANEIIDGWLQRFRLQSGTYRSHLLRMLTRSRQMLQDLEEDWKDEVDPKKRETILRRQRGEIIKLQEEAVCERQPDYCERIEKRGHMPPVEGNKEGGEKEDTEPTAPPTWQPTGEANGVGLEQEHTGDPHTHVPSTEGEWYIDTQDVPGRLRTETKTSSVELGDEQGIVGTEHGAPTSEPTVEAKSTETNKHFEGLSKGDSLGFSEREDGDDDFSYMFPSATGLESEAKLEPEAGLEPEARLEPEVRLEPEGASPEIEAKETQKEGGKVPLL